MKEMVETMGMTQKLNDFNLENFQCLNWNDVTGIQKNGAQHNPLQDPFEPFSCKGFGGGQLDCSPLFRPVSLLDAEATQSEIAKYDMLGIPQIAIDPSNSSIACKSNPVDQTAPSGAILPNLLEASDNLFDFTGMYSADHPGEDESGFTFGGTKSTEQMKKFGIATNLAAASQLIQL